MVLALLTLWLGLWPAADAVTGTSHTTIVEPVAESSAATCSLPAGPMDRPEAPRCCQIEPAPVTSGSGCCDTKRTRCCRSFSVGGMVLFATGQWTLDADLGVRGTLKSAAMIGPSRHLQPPVPPPLAIS